MIHLLKKIRRKLLIEKRLSNYVLYAVGEILLVVIGIVLAIQFSNWNAKKAEIKKEIWYLDNMANDMFNQRQELDYLKNYYISALSISKNILIDLNKKKSFKNIDSLFSKLNQLKISDPFPNVDNTYKELVSSGQVALIENDDLILDIIDFYIYNEKLENYFKTSQERIFYGEIYGVLNKYAPIDLSDYSDNVYILQQDSATTNYILEELEIPKNRLELTNAIKNKIIIVSDYKNDVIESLKMIDTMIQAIDDEIMLLEN